MHRNLIFIVVCAALLAMAIYHQANGRSWELFIDLGILAFALRAWRPWRSPWR